MNKSCISSLHQFFITYWKKLPLCLHCCSCFIETRKNGHLNLNTQGRLHQQPGKDPVEMLRDTFQQYVSSTAQHTVRQYSVAELEAVTANPLEVSRFTSYFDFKNINMLPATNFHTTTNVTDSQCFSMLFHSYTHSCSSHSLIPVAKTLNIVQKHVRKLNLNPTN